MMNLMVSIAKRILPRRYHNPAQDAYLMVQSLRHLGKRRVCPCCGWHLREFILFSGAHTRRMAPTCPRCRTKERHRWLWLYLQEHTAIQRNSIRLLHFAPEFSFYRLFQRMPNVQMVGTDLSDNGRVSVLQDITRLAFPNGTFDAIICNHVLEHVPDDRRAMAELFRVLRPGGWAIISFPVRLDQPTYEDFSITTPAEREQHFGQTDHVRWYGLDVTDRLTAAGFAVQPEYSRDVDAAVRERYGLDSDSLMFFCTKPTP